jgi:hypothetical protein
MGFHQSTFSKLNTEASKIATDLFVIKLSTSTCKGVKNHELSTRVVSIMLLSFLSLVVYNMSKPNKMCKNILAYLFPLS